MVFNYEPDILEEDIQSVIKCMRTGIARPEHISNLENKIFLKFGIPVAVCSSGTSALHAALILSGIGPGDEVICPDFTFASTWNVIEYVGATPVFVDIDPKTWCIDPDKIEENITNRTRAIIPVDIFGNPCDYEKIVKISRNHNIKVIQDCAESLGSNFAGIPAMGFGDISCTSFNLNKIVTSCGGGAIFSNSVDTIKEFKKIINQNKKGGEYDYFGPGFNYRMGSVNSAILSSQLDRFDKILIKKSKISQAYRENIKNCTFQKISEMSDSNNWVNVCRFESQEIRDGVLKSLLSDNIEAKIPFKPGTLVNWVIKKYNCNINIHSLSLFEESLILPSSPRIEDHTIEKICRIVNRA
jgi:perosamine synthetase